MESRHTKTYLMEASITKVIAMPAKDAKNFSDEEVEEIMDMHAPKGQFNSAEVRQIIRENPLLVTGLVFTFGLLLGVSLRPSHRR